MGQSFSLDSKRKLKSKKSKQRKARRKIVVTGASGNIGSYFARCAPENYELTLIVHTEDGSTRKLEKFGKVVQADLADLEQLTKCFRGCDSVLHLAASAAPDTTWDAVLANNIIGTYNVFVAARAAGCSQVVYASSIHAVSGYPPDVQVKTSDPVNPGDIYGVSKCFGEALARYMATNEGLRSIAIRIGAFQPENAARNPGSIGMLDAWVSQRDLQQLIERALEADDIQFAIVHGLSDNRFKRLDISETRDLLGYNPKDDLTDFNESLKKLDLSKVKQHSAADPGMASGIRKELKQANNTRSNKPKKK